MWQLAHSATPARAVTPCCRGQSAARCDGGRGYVTASVRTIAATRSSGARPRIASTRRAFTWHAAQNCWAWHTAQVDPVAASPWFSVHAESWEGGLENVVIVATSSAGASCSGRWHGSQLRWARWLGAPRPWQPTQRSGSARPTLMKGSVSAAAWQRWHADSGPMPARANRARCRAWSNTTLVARGGAGVQVTARTRSPLWQLAHDSGEGRKRAVSPVAMPAWHDAQVVNSRACRACGNESASARTGGGGRGPVAGRAARARQRARERRQDRQRPADHR